MSSTDTLARLIPLRVVRKLFVIKTVLALVITAGKVKVDNADRALNLMFLAAVNSSKLRVDIRVKLVRVKSVLIVWIVVLPKLVSSPAFSQTRLPMVAGPSREITFAAFGPTTMVPATDVQLARGDASAWELMVIVGWEQKELVDVCAATPPATAKAGRMYCVNIVYDYYVTFFGLWHDNGRYSRVNRRSQIF